MHLSRLLIDPLDARAARALASPYRLHQAVMAGFDPEPRGETRVLFRVEPERKRGRVMLLVQSEIAPRWERAAERFFGEGLDAQVKPAWVELKASQRLRFRLRANPTMKREGKRVGLYGEPSQRAWLERKLVRAGAAAVDYRVLDEGLLTDQEPRLELQSALYDGYLQVCDPQALMAALVEGLGSGKAFGFGLLSVARGG